jgi:hypothetical protein
LKTEDLESQFSFKLEKIEKELEIEEYFIEYEKNPDFNDLLDEE